MSVMETPDTATIWLANGMPVRMVWHGRRWKVTDTPTEPEGYFWATHAPTVPAWRFQGTADDGEARVFDVVHAGAEWRVVRVYE